MATVPLPSTTPSMSANKFRRASIFDRFHRLFFPCCEAHLLSTASRSER